MTEQSEAVRASLERLMAAAEHLLPKIKDIEVEKIGDLVDQELQQTTDAIEQAAKRFEVCKKIATQSGSLDRFGLSAYIHVHRCVCPLH